ncbi:MAG: discoidin domain-containing protein [Clostridia bacterium]
MSKSKISSNSIKLDVFNNPSITLYTHHSLLQLIPGIDDLQYWWLCNFINVFYHYDYPTSYDYTDYKRYYDGIFDITKMNYDDLLLLDHKVFWKKQLLNQKYIYLWLNLKYLYSSCSYLIIDDYHPILIYGFENETFSAKSFSANKSIYELSFSLENLITAIKKTLEENPSTINDDDIVMILKQKKYSSVYVKNRHFPFLSFYRELSDYLYGFGNMNDWYHFFQESESYPSLHTTIYGIKISELLLKYLDNKENLRVFDYRFIHMITENKKMISSRLSAIAQHYDLTSKLFNYSNEYKALSDNYNVFRLLCIKLSLKKTNRGEVYSTSDRAEQMKKLYDTLYPLVEQEKILLKKVLDIIEENCLISIFSPEIQKLDDTYVQDGYRYINLKKQYDTIFTCNNYAKGKLHIETNTASYLEHTQTLFYDTINIYRTNSECKWLRYKISKEKSVAKTNLYGLNRSPFSKAFVTASSSVAGNENIKPENVLEYNDTCYWSPENDDQFPFLIFTLQEVIRCQNCAISEFEESIQISKFAIDVKTSQNGWEEVLQIEKPDKTKTFITRFDPIEGKDFRMRILKPIKSLHETYPIRITYFSLY